MKVFFDDGNYVEDLDKMVASLDRFDKPMVVMPTESEAKRAKNNYSSYSDTCRITFISFDYWISKKWIADDDYDHIDFFKIDKALSMRCYGIKAGCLTVDRTLKKRVEKEAVEIEEVKGEE